MGDDPESYLYISITGYDKTECKQHCETLNAQKVAQEAFNNTNYNKVTACQKACKVYSKKYKNNFLDDCTDYCSLLEVNAQQAAANKKRRVLDTDTGTDDKLYRKAKR